jgi:hypothetical protein
MLKLFFLKGYREQLNLLSSFIDGSQVYGIDLTRSQQLRTFNGGNSHRDIVH